MAARDGGWHVAWWHVAMFLVVATHSTRLTRDRGPEIITNYALISSSVSLIALITKEQTALKREEASRRRCREVI